MWLSSTNCGEALLHWKRLDLSVNRLGHGPQIRFRRRSIKLEENTMSIPGQHALQDMVELQMYLVAEPGNMPWRMLRRGANRVHEGKEPYSDCVESSAAHELMDHGFIEATSRFTFVISKLGHQFYEREMNGTSVDL
jgi:hypothetical protein